MGYCASYNGFICLRKLSKSDIDLINQKMQMFAIENGETIYTEKRGLILYRPDYSTDIYMIASGDLTLIYLSGDDKYHDDGWIKWLDIIYKYVDSNEVNQVEFSGEDGNLWRFLLTDEGVYDQAGHIVYDN